MSVKVTLGAAFRKITGERETAEVRPCTLGECVDRLEGNYPGTKAALGDPMVHVFVNGDEAFLPDDAQRDLRMGDEVQIALAAVV